MSGKTKKMKRQHISSAQNPVLKELRKLLDNATFRKREKLLVVEGEREISLAIRSGLRIDKLFICSELAAGAYRPEEKCQPESVIELPRQLFERFSYRENPDGYIAVAGRPNYNLGDVHLPAKPLVIVLEAVEKPGNLGAVMRTADAAGVDAVILCDPTVDPYNPNAIRASMGTIFTKKLIISNNVEALEWLNGHGLSICAACLAEDSISIFNANLTGPTALVFGTEHSGLSDFWLSCSSHKIKIPMLGEIDSLNLSNSVAIAAYEAYRQRA
jgi:RNA methyltransferase, TrmH family